MGATRKLQGEIDRVLKKVQEGVDVFDGIWNKVYDTENANQKEKFEADLKKEIKKLQRYRDQIKTWIQSSEIKDKKALVDARKLIEREMERFKVCEKETKTKAFSKEGLGQQPKTDPREKAKGESREWLNNMVSELETQIDSFESEMEGLQVKKGKQRPPRLMHLEDSIVRHKAHIQKLEMVLRLLDNDELSPDMVGDIKDLVEDYIERNQDDFEEFEDVDDMYSGLPLEKMESLENLEALPAVPVAVVVKEKAAVAAAGGVPLPLSSKPPLPPPPAAQQAEQAAAAAAAAAASTASPDRVDEVAPQLSPASSGDVSGPLSDAAALKRPSGLLIPPRMAPPPPLPASKVKDEESSPIGSPMGSSLATRRLVPLLNVPTSPAGAGRSIPAPSASGVEAAKRPARGVPEGIPSLASFGEDEFAGGAGPPHIRSFTPEIGSHPEALPSVGGGLNLGLGGEASASVLGAQQRMFNSVGAQWRPGLPSSTVFQNQPEVYHGRTEIAPDQKQRYISRFQQVQQQGVSATVMGAAAAALAAGAAQGLPHLPPAPALQLLGSSGQQAAIPGASPTADQGAVASTLQFPGAQEPAAQTSSPADAGGTGAGQAATLPEGESPEGAPSASQGNEALAAAFSRGLALEDDLKNSDTFNVNLSGPGTLTELSHLSQVVEFPTGGTSAPASLMQSGSALAGPAVAGRTQGLDSVPSMDAAAVPGSARPEHQTSLALLEAALLRMPQAKDSERSGSYVPRNPVATPLSYPQAPSATVDNPALFERLDSDVLFFAFYYQQGTYQQYLAARELKKQSWRYHKKYNTWFQRHEEPKMTTDEYEQGTYVYFDFHIVHDDYQTGWCQRIKTEFTFEYSYLEDDLAA